MFPCHFLHSLISYSLVVIIILDVKSTKQVSLVPTLHDDTDDVLVWRDMEGIFRPFSVWLQMRGLSGMDVIPPRLADVVSFLILISKGRSGRRSLQSLVEAIVSCSAEACYLQVQEGERCTLFSFSKVFPTRFFLGRSFKETDSSGSFAPFVLLLDGEEFALVTGFILLVYADLVYVL
ncbi:hypothetical protein Tco_1318079 [Tanacetum coccineum]